MTQFKGGYIIGKVKRRIFSHTSGDEREEHSLDEINGFDPVELLLDFLDENQGKKVCVTFQVIEGPIPRKAVKKRLP